MITPTVGRVVLYRPIHEDRGYNGDPAQRFSARIAQVNPSGTVNLAVDDAFGRGFGVTNVVLCQDDAVPKVGEAEWMPYQKAVAAGAAPMVHVSPETPSGAS